MDVIKAIAVTVLILGTAAWLESLEPTEPCPVDEHYSTPSAIYKPKLSIDGNQWCSLYGENLQDGVAGFGDSPELDMLDFDKNWREKLPQSIRSKP